MANFPLSQVEGGGVDVSPIVSQAKFLPSYPSTVGETYFYDPLGKQFVPEKFAGSELATAPYLGSVSTSIGNRFGSACITTDDGEQWVFALTFASAATNTTAYLQLYRKVGQTLVHQSETTLSGFAAMAPQNSDITMPVRCGSLDTWAFLVGNYIVGPTADAKLIKAVYTEGTKTWAFTTGSDMQPAVNCNLVSADVIYDATDSSIMVFYPQGVSANIEWHRHDFASLTKSNGNVAVRSGLTARQYTSANGFSCAMLLSDDNYVILGSVASFQGGVYSWNGSVFSSTGTNNLGAFSSYGIKIADDTFISQATISRATSSVNIAQYTPGTTTLDFQAQMSYSRLAIPSFTSVASSNSATHFEYIGENTLLVMGTDSRGYISWDSSFNILPERTKLVSTGNASSNVYKNFMVDERYICYTTGLISHGSTDNLSPVLATFCGSQIVDGYRPVEAGSLVGETGGNIDISVTTEVKTGSVALTAGQIYGEYVAIDTTKMIPRDLKEHSFYMCHFKSYNDSLLQGITFSPTIGVNNVNLNTGTGASSRNIKGISTGHFWAVASNGTAADVSAIFTDSGVPLDSFKQALNASSTSRGHFKATGIRNLGIALYTEDNGIELDGTMEVI